MGDLFTWKSSERFFNKVQSKPSQLRRRIHVDGVLEWAMEYVASI